MTVICIDASQDKKGNAIEGNRWLEEGKEYEAKNVITIDENGMFAPGYILRGFSPKDGFDVHRFIQIENDTNNKSSHATTERVKEISRAQTN